MGKQHFDTWFSPYQGPIFCTTCGKQLRGFCPSDATTCSLLVWTPHPDDPRVILGKSKRAPETTLYVIELMDGRKDRGKMRGAFMSDELEREGLYDKALVNWLKWEAESQMREFLKSHTANAEGMAAGADGSPMPGN